MQISAITLPTESGILLVSKVVSKIIENVFSNLSLQLSVTRLTTVNVCLVLNQRFQDKGMSISTAVVRNRTLTSPSLW